MARQLRVDYIGAFHHVMARGNERRDIFLTDGDRNAFLKVIAETSNRFMLKIIAYVLMRNHYHLLLQSNGARLSKGMHWLGTTYTTRYNLNHQRIGHLFQGRFKSILVQNESYLLRLSYYIHRNPVRARLVDRLRDYIWSSCRFYTNAKERKPDWLNTELLLSQFPSPNPANAYLRAIEAFAIEEESLRDELKCGIILGTDEFTLKMKKELSSSGKTTNLPILDSTLRRMDPHVVIKAASGFLGCNFDELIKGPRIKRKDRFNRDFILYLLWQSGKMTNQEIGRIFNLTFSAVSRRVRYMKEELCLNKDLQIQIEEIKSIIKV